MFILLIKLRIHFGYNHALVIKFSSVEFRLAKNLVFMFSPQDEETNFSGSS